jgi:hypothetical protein
MKKKNYECLMINSRRMHINMSIDSTCHSSICLAEENLWKQLVKGILELKSSRMVN